MIYFRNLLHYGLKMVFTPIDALPYLRGLQAVLAGYEGYTKGKRRAADQAVRNELVRAARRTRNHITNIHDAAFVLGRHELAQSAKRCCSSIDAFVEDVSKASSGVTHSFLSGQRVMKNGDQKRLIRHDYEVITLVTKATNLANAAERQLGSNQDPVEVEQLVKRCQQMVTSSAGFFSERTMMLDGLRQKKRRK